ncbi:MAG: hypothetical protein PHH47_10405 [Gallionella sp.]|nr:hypothetical protein [Gallionella sp.]MDD4947744.1 hypothetical protein [Gallionella sp.]MDD5613157.1 hypothetical protein [Gallionella sp.]
MSNSNSRFIRQLITFITFACTFLATSASNAALIHQYTFLSGTAIDSVGGANGTLFGGASIVGGELLLNGTGYVETLGNHIIPTAGDFTLSMDVKQTAFGSAYVELISQGSSGSGFYLGYSPAKTMRVTDAYLNTAIPFPTDGLYHNYTLSVSGNITSLYIDHVLQGTFLNIARGIGGTNTRFGEQFNVNGLVQEYFTGSMKNILVYDTNLAGVAVPTPSSYALVLAGLGFMGITRNSRSRKTISKSR